jgi:hypothetical protein
MIIVCLVVIQALVRKENVTVVAPHVLAYLVIGNNVLFELVGGLFVLNNQAVKKDFALPIGITIMFPDSSLSQYGFAVYLHRWWINVSYSINYALQLGPFIRTTGWHNFFRLSDCGLNCTTPKHHLGLRFIGDDDKPLIREICY